MRDLVGWFRRQQRVLPWREDPSLYRVWISEIMLQQTQVVTVLPYFERFVRLFPSVEALASAPEEAVLKAWEGLGYYSRARNLHRGAKQIVASGFPRTRDGWIDVPGVGPYTAGAITSIALGHPEPIVDGNVERVFSRLRRLHRSANSKEKGKTGETAYKAELWRISAESVKRAHRDGFSPSDLNQAWMELGATICSPKKPSCQLCPIARECEAKRVGDAESFPEKKKRAEWIAITEARVAWIDSSGEKVLLARAAEGKWRAGLWDFPEASPIREASGGSRGGHFRARKLGTIESRHVVTRHKISRTIEVFEVPERARKASARNELRNEREELRWVSLTSPEVPLGSACAKGLGLIRERFYSGSLR